MRWNDGDHGWGWGGWILMLVMMVLFWGAIAWAVIAVARHGGTRAPADPSRPAPPDAHRILEERFARGEIDATEFAHRRDVLRDAR